ncbi:alpha/beta fold hydrolase [Pseudoxanthomonas sp. NC8]|nr:alpha/beta fold hydrolase [Pseudoxanthomonas sp. NC8]
MPASGDAAPALRGEIAVALPMRHAGVREVRLRYEVQGPAAAPVVFIAGGISAHRHVSASDAFPEPGWANALVAAGRTWICPAIGSSPSTMSAPMAVSTHRSTPPTKADAIAVLLDALEIDRLQAFVGYSYGAMVGLQFAARHPHRLQTLVAVSGAHRPHPYASVLARAAAPRGGAGPVAVRRRAGGALWRASSRCSATARRRSSASASTARRRSSTAACVAPPRTTSTPPAPSTSHAPRSPPTCACPNPSTCTGSTRPSCRCRW